MIMRNCPLCGACDNKRMEKFSKATWAIVQCCSCAFVFLHNAPDYSTLQEDFDWAQTAKQERQKRREGRRVYYAVSDTLKRIKGFIRRGQRKEIMIINKLRCSGRAIDVGCGDGTTLRGLPDSLIPHGVEISPSLAKKADEYCRSKNSGGGRVICDSAAAGLLQFPADFADLIIMRSYLEHEINPKAVLQSAKICLKPDGIILIKVPNFACWNRVVRGVGWPGFRFPDHVNYFTPATLREMVVQSGLVIKKFNFLDKIPTGDNMWMMATKHHNH